MLLVGKREHGNDNQQLCHVAFRTSGFVGIAAPSCRGNRRSCCGACTDLNQAEQVKAFRAMYIGTVEVR